MPSTGFWNFLKDDLQVVVPASEAARFRFWVNEFQACCRFYGAARPARRQEVEGDRRGIRGIRLAGPASPATTSRYDRRPEATRRRAAELLRALCGAPSGAEGPS